MSRMLARGQERRAQFEAQQAERRAAEKAAESEAINAKIRLQRQIVLRMMHAQLARGFGSWQELCDERRRIRQAVGRMHAGTASQPHMPPEA